MTNGGTQRLGLSPLPSYLELRAEAHELRRSLGVAQEHIDALAKAAQHMRKELDASRGEWAHLANDRDSWRSWALAGWLGTLLLLAGWLWRGYV